MSDIHALVIDDNTNNIGVLAELLRLEGVKVTTIQNPLKIEAALEQPVDIIFLDLEMPEMDGYEVLGHLKADSRLAGVPVVAYTVHVSEMITARQMGFHSFLGKPLDADKFPHQLEKILQGERVWSMP